MVEKGLLRYVTGATKKPNDDVDKSCKKNLASKQEMALGTLLKNISDPVKYHIRNITNPIEIWTKLEALYGIIDEDMAYTIEDMYRAQLKDCGEPIKDGKLIKHVMTHLPPEYATFVSSYNTHKLTMGSAFTKPSFESFSRILVLEHEKLVSMGILQSSKTKALVANEGNSSGKKFNKKKKRWKVEPQDDTQKSSSTHQSNSLHQSFSTQKSSSQQGKSFSNNNKKGNNFNKREMKTCAYCKKNGHDEHECKDKKIDELLNIMRKHKIDVPNTYKDKASSTT